MQIDKQIDPIIIPSKKGRGWGRLRKVKHLFLGLYKTHISLIKMDNSCSFVALMRFFSFFVRPFLKSCYHPREQVFAQFSSILLPTFNSALFDSARIIKVMLNLRSANQAQLRFVLLAV